MKSTGATVVQHFSCSICKKISENIFIDWNGYAHYVRGEDEEILRPNHIYYLYCREQDCQIFRFLRKISVFRTFFCISAFVRFLTFAIHFHLNVSQVTFCKVRITFW